MKSYVDLNVDEVKILLSGLHNLVLDKELLDYWTGKDSRARFTIENLINKFEESFEKQ